MSHGSEAFRVFPPVLFPPTNTQGKGAASFFFHSPFLFIYEVMSNWFSRVMSLIFKTHATLSNNQTRSNLESFFV